MSPRDTQRGRLYRAEQAFRTAIGDRQFKSRLDYLVFIERVERDKWFQRTYGARKFVVHDGRGRRTAAAWGRRSITLPKWARTPVVILHEIAHCAAQGDSTAMAAHGWEFARTFLTLVRHFLGREAYLKLRGHFTVFRVRYKQPRAKRPMSEAQRRAFAAMRAAQAEKRAANAKPPEES